MATNQKSAQRNVLKLEGSKASGLRLVPQEGPAQNPGYIVGPFFDYFNFIYAPVVALLLGGLTTRWDWGNSDQAFFGKIESPVDFLLGSFVFAHLFIVVFRSYFNKTIFKAYPYRFTVVPVLAAAAMYFSEVALVFGVVIATWWDVYHSGLQTWGLGRIYDSRIGNPPEQGRWLDYGLNSFAYAGPIFSGASLILHFERFSEFNSLGWDRIAALATDDTYSAVFAPYVISAGAIYLIYYLARYRTLIKEGYKVSPQKVGLLVSTTLVSVFVWGTNPLGKAMFIMNFFHAWQYFAIVWCMEKKNIGTTLKLPQKAQGAMFLGLLLVVGFAYGVWAEVATDKFLYLSLTVSMMHFWWDGFVWSVRRKQV